MQHEAEPILEVKGLTTHFLTKSGVVRAVDGIDLTLRRGEILCLVGESGSGKSVTGLSIMRLIEPPGCIVAGSIRFGDTDVLRLSDEEMDKLRGARIAMIFQEPMTALDPVYRVGAQVAEGLRLHEGLSRRAAQQRSIELLERVGIPDAAPRAMSYPHELSGGLRQRVMIAMAIACGPDLIIADEPTTALDVTIQAQILSLIDEMRAEVGASVLLITHDLGVVAEVADRVAVMYAGQIVEEAPVVDLFRSPAHPYTRALLACVPDVEAPFERERDMPAIHGTVPNPLAWPDGCRFRDRCPAAHDRCRTDSPVFRASPAQTARCWLHAD